jgi:hypothetical protein
MKIRRYYGFDCDSVMGFNNGSYVDDEFIEVASHEEAMQLCLEALKECWNIDKASLEEQDNGYEFTTGYYDNDGNDISREEFLERNENEEYGSWRYVYVTYESEE